MTFEDNVGEDGLSAQSSYTIDINDTNYIDNLAPDPTMFDKVGAFCATLVETPQ